MKEKTQHHEFFKQFKEKGELVEYMKTHTPESEKRPFATPGMCCGWCERPIESGIEIGKNTYSALCPKCFEYSAAWNKEKGTKY